jgi:hypothetical protein
MALDILGLHTYKERRLTGDNGVSTVAQIAEPRSWDNGVLFSQGMEGVFFWL